MSLTLRARFIGFPTIGFRFVRIFLRLAIGHVVLHSQTLLLASLPVPTSSTGAYRGCCTPSCTGWTYIQARSHHVQLPARSSSKVSDGLLSTGLRCGVAAALPFSHAVDVFWSYRVTVSARTAAGLLPSLVRRPGTLSRIISGFQTLLQTTSSAC